MILGCAGADRAILKKIGKMILIKLVELSLYVNLYLKSYLFINFMIEWLSYVYNKIININMGCVNVDFS